jgi:chemotaxis protein CheD
MDNADQPLRDCFLFPGEFYLGREPSLVSAVLGTGVAVCLWRSDKGYGGMVHFLYPCTADRRKASAEYGDMAVRHLIKAFLDEGAKVRHLQGQIFGGSWNGTLTGTKIAKDNVRIARTVLASQHIPLLSEDTGGALGRKMVYNTATNETLVYRANALRRGDWYPYDEG